MTAEELIKEITDELAIEFKNDVGFDVDILALKVKDGYRKVRNRKCYENTSKTEEKIIEDLYQRHIQNIKDIAAYNYAKIGGDFQTSHSENGVSRSWITENEVLGNITAFVKVL